MTSAATALVAALLAGGAPDVFQAEVAAKAGVRAVETGSDQTTAFELDPRLALGLNSRDGDLRFATAYDPALVQVDDGQRILQVLHRGMLRIEVQTSRAWRFTTSIDGSYGTSDPMFALRGQPAGTFNVVPTNQPLRTASGDLELALDGQVGTRTSARLALAVFGSGGADPEARTQFPALFGARGEGGLVWKATRRDDLSLNLTGTGTSITPDGRAAFGILSGKWRRELTRTVAGWVGAGAGASWAQPRGLPSETGPVFSAELGLAHSPRPRPPPLVVPGRPAAAVPPATAPEPEAEVPGTPATPEGADQPAGVARKARRDAPKPGEAPQPLAPGATELLAEIAVPAERAIDRLSEELVARLAPTVDRSTGAVGEQVEASVLGQWRASESFTLSARATGGVLLLDSAGSPLVAQVELRASWAFARGVALGWGLDAHWQQPTTTTADSPPSLADYGAFLSVSWGIGKR